MVACLFILPGHLLVGVVGFCDMTALLPRHERGERWDSRAAPPSKLVLHRSWFISPPLYLTEDLTDKMLVHVNKNDIAGFVFEHSFEWYNFRWHASAFIVLYIMLVQFLVVLIYSKVLVRCTEEWNALIGELRLHSSGLLTASVAPPALVASAAVFNVQSVVYFICWLNKCVVRMTNTMFWKSLHGSIL